MKRFLTPRVIRITLGVMLALIGLYGHHINDPYRFEHDNYCRYNTCPEVEYPLWTELTLYGGILLLLGPPLIRLVIKSYRESRAQQASGK